MDIETGDAAPGFAFADDGLLNFENLHVDAGPELPEEITDIHWLFADGVEVSVQLPVDLPADVAGGLPLIHDVGSAGADWLL